MIACHSCGSLHESAADLLAHDCARAYAGRLGRRGELYRILRAAGEAGVSHRDLGEHGIPCAMVHVESLRFEGHVIQRWDGSDEAGLPVARVALVKDAWAEDAAGVRQRSDGLTHAEGIVSDALADAANAFERLEPTHPRERDDFGDAIHQAQALLAVRICRREHPRGWPTYS